MKDHFDTHRVRDRVAVPAKPGRRPARKYEERTVEYDRRRLARAGLVANILIGAAQWPPADSATGLLHRAIGHDRGALATIRTLKKGRDDELAGDLCMALVEHPPLDAFPLLHYPRHCWVDLLYRAGGHELRVRGTAVLLDRFRRWFMVVCVSVNGLPVAVLRRFGRDGETEQETVLVEQREREWRQLVRLWPDPPTRGSRTDGWIDQRGASVLWDLRPDTAPLVPHHGPRCKAGDVRLSLGLWELLWAPWAGWCAHRATLAEALGLTRWGALWF